MMMASSSSIRPQPFLTQHPTARTLTTYCSCSLPSSLQTLQLKSSNSASISAENSAGSLTRRSGIGAGLSWIGFLSAGVISEKINTGGGSSFYGVVSRWLANDARDVEMEEEVILPNGIKYYEMKAGTRGAFPNEGDLVVVNLKGKVVGGRDGDQVVIVDTFDQGLMEKKKKKKGMVLVMGSRPYSKGMCEGVEQAVRSMKCGGVRRVIVPPSLGFGDNGADLGSSSSSSQVIIIPPSSTLEYIVEVQSVFSSTCLV